VAGGQSVEVLDARDALVVGKQRLEGRDRVASAASIDVGIAERVAGDECVAVVGAEDSLAVGKQRVEDRDCLADPPVVDIRVETSSAAAKLGADLRALRVERELTLRELGDKIGFPAQYISGAELARTTVSARFVAACDRILEADGALVALLPDVVWEKELRRQERSSARDRLASSLRGASGNGEGGDDVNPTSRRGLVDAGAAAALGSGAAVAPAAGRAIDPALPRTSRGP
jgi:transcriptional regulator with XRE-family HTH domain